MAAQPFAIKQPTLRSAVFSKQKTPITTFARTSPDFSHPTLQIFFYYRLAFHKAEIDIFSKKDKQSLEHLEPFCLDTF